MVELNAIVCLHSGTGDVHYKYLILSGKSY